MSNLTLHIEGGVPESAENYETQQRLLDLFEKCLRIQESKAQAYGSACRSQGYMGNLARVLSKAARLKNMLWRDFSIATRDESVDDTLMDLINLAGFMHINLSTGNKWGDEQ